MSPTTSYNGNVTVGTAKPVDSWAQCVNLRAGISGSSAIVKGCTQAESDTRGRTQAKHDAKGNTQAKDDAKGSSRAKHVM